jgi:hypothetical protein
LPRTLDIFKRYLLDIDAEFATGSARHDLLEGIH